MENMELILAVSIGIGLAAASGLRIFVPLLALSIAGRFGGMEIAPGLSWVESTPALVAFAVATVLEVAAYSVPWLDNLLDGAAAPLAVAAGVILTAAVLTDVSPFVRWSLAIIGGGSVAGIVHSGTSILRQVSSFTTGGLANPVVAAGEGAGSLVMAILALLVPLVALVGVVVLLVLAARGLAKFAATRRRPAPATPTGG